MIEKPRDCKKALKKLEIDTKQCHNRQNYYNQQLNDFNDTKTEYKVTKKTIK